MSFTEYVSSILSPKSLTSLQNVKISKEGEIGTLKSMASKNPEKSIIVEQMKSSAFEQVRNFKYESEEEVNSSA